jgi:hypothetical protein
MIKVKLKLKIPFDGLLSSGLTSSGIHPTEVGIFAMIKNHLQFKKEKPRIF